MREGEAGAPATDVERLHLEIDRRVQRARESMSRSDLDALVVFGGGRLSGSLRYLSGYSPDRCGREACASDSYSFDGAAVVVGHSGTPVLLLAPGLFVHRRQALEYRQDWEAGLTPAGLLGVLSEVAPGARRLGVEPWQMFPAHLYMDLRALMPKVEFLQTHVVEDLRLTKSPYEIAILESAGRIADSAHAAVVEALQEGAALTELDLVRVAEGVLRNGNPDYDDYAPSSVSLISTGRNELVGAHLHAPRPGEPVRGRSVITWDVGGRHQGYAIDTARTRAMGTISAEVSRAHDALTDIRHELISFATPGAQNTQLMEVAQQVARRHNVEIWNGFLGHGIGLDTKEKPDVGTEDLVLRENMVMTLEPRILVDQRWVVGGEETFVVTSAGGRSFETYPQELRLDV